MPNKVMEPVPIGTIKVSKNPDVVYSIGNLTSGIAITLYDLKLKIGGIAYILLPESSIEQGNRDANMLKYADVAVPELIKKYQENGGQKQNVLVRIVGGAQMFNFGGGANSLNTGSRNVTVIKTLFTKLGYVVDKAEVGGNKTRQFKFSLSNGQIQVKQMDREDLIM